MFVLAIDTSNKILSVAIAQDKKVLVELNEETKNNHSARLMPVVEKAFFKAGITPQQLDLIAVAQGPGSYTGVRIGVTVAKTLAWTLNKPLVGVSSLEVLARNLSLDGVIAPLFDARRQTVFGGAYHKGYQPLIPDGHYNLADFLGKLPPGPVHFLGDAEAFRDEIIQKLGPDAYFYPEKNAPHATELAFAAQLQPPIGHVHGFAPKYHRMPEAEVNWLLEQGAGNV